MSGKVTLSIYDDVHDKNAEGIEYDLWRINNNSNRVNIKHTTLTNDNQHVLLEASTPEQLGSYEVILFTKDYFERFNENIQVRDSRVIVPFGINERNEDYHLNIHITPTSYTCTL
jgi:5-hydroxyisourate hydrolase-like protein (transthyretin family)